MSIFTYYEVKHRVTEDRFEPVGKFATLPTARKFVQESNMTDLSITEHNLVVNEDFSISDNYKFL